MVEVVLRYVALLKAPSGHHRDKREFWKALNGFRFKCRTAWDKAQDICNPDERIYESDYND